MRNEIVDNEYFEWLCSQVGYLNGDGYDILLGCLHSVPFRWVISSDSNRAEDGLELRDIFVDSEGWNTYPIENEPCTVLEMMVALAMRIENDIMWNGEEDRTQEWFWIQVSNLGLDIFDDDHWDGMEVKAILDQFMDREVVGKEMVCCFPVRGWTLREQKKAEIWYQMQAFLMENYDF